MKAFVCLVFFLLFSSLVLAAEKPTTTLITTSTTSSTTTSTTIIPITTTIPFNEKEDKEKLKDIYTKIETSDLKMEFLGTEYVAGEPAVIWLQLLRSYQPINNATCYATAYYPNKTMFLNRTLMNFLSGSDGLYYYDLTAPSTIGIYMLSALCAIPQNAFSDDFIDRSKIEELNNVTIQLGKAFLSNVAGELPNYKGIDTTADMTGNVLLYHLDELSGTITDYSGEGNNGTASGTSYGFKGVFDKSLKFLTTSYVNAGSKENLNIRDAITVSFWINTTTQTINAYPFYKAGYIAFYTNPYNTMRFYLNLNGSVVYVNTGVYGANEWHHIVGTYDKDAGTGNFRIYLDGVLQQQLSYSGQIKNTSTYNLYLGSNAGANGWSGLIDEVAVWNRSLSAAEVKNLYDRTAIIPANRGNITSQPITLSGANWYDFSSDYALKDGSISFKILDSANNPICSSLGDISACAGSTSQIKVYAELTKPFSNSTSPEINRWWVTWSVATIEEIRGAGEIHISSASSSIAEKVWTEFFIKGTPPLMPSTNYYCADSSTLMKNISFDFCEAGVCKAYAKAEPQFCAYGCDTEMNPPICREAPYVIALKVFGGVVVFLLLLFVILKWAGKV
jgi:hypothetical protein